MLNITHEDCMDLMARYPDKYFDLAIVDPPYGIDTAVERGTGRYAEKYIPRGKKWDKTPPENYFTELFRVSDHQIIWGAQYFNLPIRRGWICWYKTDEVRGRSFSEFELAWTSWNKAARHYSLKPFLKDGKRYHPTQKPVQLYGWLLSTYARPGWTILDTHLGSGSGSSAIACHNMGFDLVACEIDQDYYLNSKQRIEEHIQQQELFSTKEYQVRLREVELFEELRGAQ
ncbi:methyltransferase [Spirochaetia bacterium]|nr:methyltransferase [Spirochaetia bacterium]